MEYAVKAVENGGTAIGIRCKDGVVLAVEKIISSKLLKPGANKRIATVDRHVGIVRSSPLSDISMSSPGMNLQFSLFQSTLIRFRSLSRFRLVLFPTVVISFLEPGMKHHRGEVHTKAQFPFRRSQTVSVATYKRTHFTPAYGHLVSPPLSVDGIAKRSYQSTARSAPVQSQALEERSRMPKLVGQAFT